MCFVLQQKLQGYSEMLLQGNVSLNVRCGSYPLKSEKLVVSRWCYA